MVLQLVKIQEYAEQALLEAKRDANEELQAALNVKHVQLQNAMLHAEKMQELAIQRTLENAEKMKTLAIQDRDKKANEVFTQERKLMEEKMER